MLARTELGLGGRAMLADAEPFSAGVFTDIYWGSKLLDNSQRNGFTWNAGVLASLTALTHVTITGAATSTCGAIATARRSTRQRTTGSPATDPTAVCKGYLARVIQGKDPSDFSIADQKRAEKLTGQSGMDFFGRDQGARFMVSLIGEIAVDQHWNIFGILEGAPFQGQTSARCSRTCSRARCRTPTT